MIKKADPLNFSFSTTLFPLCAFGIGATTATIDGPHQTLKGGSIWLIQSVAMIALQRIMIMLAKQFRWSVSTYHFAMAGGVLALTAIGIITGIALNILGALGASLMAYFSLLIFSTYALQGILSLEQKKAQSHDNCTV